MSSFHGKLKAITKPNKGGFISFKLDDQDQFFGCGKAPPPAQIGDTVLFDATQNGDFWNANMKTFQVKSSSEPTSNSIKSTNTQSDTQSSIEYQVALKAATELTVALITAGRYKEVTDSEIMNQVTEHATVLFKSIKSLGAGEKNPLAPDDFNDKLPF